MMRGLVCCAILLVVCVFAQVQGDCEIEGEMLSVGVHFRNCLKYTCHEDGTQSALGCPEYRCREGEQIGYREQDNTKPYGECCGGPICKEH